MELAVIWKETVGRGQTTTTEQEVLSKFELMDGGPVKGETVPIWFYLSNVDLTPTYKDINNRFSCKYFLNLILVDEEDRRYFKQAEIILWRKRL